MKTENMRINELLAELEPKDLDKDKTFIINTLKAKLIEDILVAMEEDNISQSSLAQKLNKSKQYISKILNETINFTLDTIVDISLALNRTVSIRIVNVEENSYTCNSEILKNYCVSNFCEDKEKSNNLFVA